MFVNIRCRMYSIYMARETGCPLSSSGIISFSAILSHFSCGLSSQKEDNFFSEPGPRNVCCPAPNLLSNREMSLAFDSHSKLLSLDPHEMSLNIDMKIILPVNFSGVFILWGRWKRRRRRYSPCSKRWAGFAWRSGCRAQWAARSAWKGRKGRRWWRTNRSREWKRWTQGGTHMYMDDMTGLRTWATKCVWPNIQVWRRVRALSACSGVVHLARVHVRVIVLVVDVVCLMLFLSARVVVHAVFLAYP